MAAQGRKNVHGKAGVRFKAGYTKSKHENKLRTLVTDLVKYERITVTSGMVKELRSLAEHMITLGKRGDLHARRQAASVLRSEEALTKVFGELSTRYASRNGGYTRALKCGVRLGDNAQKVMIEFIK